MQSTILAFLGTLTDVIKTVIPPEYTEMNKVLKLDKLENITARIIILLNLL